MRPIRYSNFKPKWMEHLTPDQLAAMDAVMDDFQIGPTENSMPEQEQPRLRLEFTIPAGVNPEQVDAQIAKVLVAIFTEQWAAVD